MAAETITFNCPSCNVLLSVPSAVAGVTGPCPTCRAIITAPLPPVQEPSLAVQTSGAAVKTEPRNLPSRAAGEMEARPIGDSTPPRDQVRIRRRAKLHRLTFRVMMPLICLLLTLLVILGVVKFMKHDLRSASARSKPSESVSPSAEAEGAPAVQAPVEAAGSNDIQVLPGIRAMPVLEAFLNAKTLDERLPLIETKASPEELADTVIAKPFPELLRYTAEHQELHPLENSVDVYFNAEFDAGDDRKDVQLILVRIREGQEPKVVVDPFLDLFGGRLAAYAAGPQETAGVFQVILSASAYVQDGAVPNPEKKIPLKLLASPGMKAVAIAYSGRHSAIGEMLGDPTSGLAYGQARACTVLLRWNTEEQPGQPFLEALKINALHWNP